MARLSFHFQVPCCARLALAAVGLLWLAGCATGPGGKEKSKYVFFPPPPAAPRLQFLVSYSDGNDLTGEVSEFAKFITGVKPPSMPIVKPYGVFLNDQKIYVCDTGSHSVDILDLAQQKMRQFSPGGSGSLAVPINVAVDKDGSLYVADTGRNQVLCYNPDESFRAAIGQGDALRPTALALSADRLYVADLKGHCVRVYDKANQKQLFTIPRNPEAPEEQEPGKLFMPANVALDAQGRLYACDTAACKVKVYDAEGKYLRTVGEQGDRPGQFARPKGLAVDQAGRLYVVDAAAQVCQIFDAEGKLLMFFGEPNASAASLDLPAGIAIDYQHVGQFQKYAAPGFVVENLVVITSQFGPRKVNIYGLGHKK